MCGQICIMCFWVCIFFNITVWKFAADEHLLLLFVKRSILCTHFISRYLFEMKIKGLESVSFLT